MEQNLDHVIQFLKNMEFENNNQKIKINELESYSKNLTNDYDNLSKISIISNLDKQLKEKINIISSLEQQLEKANRSNNKNTKIDHELKEKNTKIFFLENELEKINSAYEKNLSLLKNENILLNKEINELKTHISKMENKQNEKLNNDSDEESDEESDDKYQITFKKVNYLVDNDDNVYNIVNDKANVIIGKLVNKKVKFL